MTSYRLFRSLGLIAILIVAAVFTGCITITSTGRSSCEMKHDLENSFLLRSAAMFYPHGVPPNPELLDPDVGSATTRALEKTTRAYLAALEEYHRARAGVLAAHIGIPLMPALPTPRLLVTRTGQAISRAEVNGDITIDVRVLQAAFRTSLIAGLAKASVSSNPARQSEKDEAERERLRNFLDLREKILKTPCHTTLGDIFADDDDTWSAYVAMDRQSERLERAYQGTILFLIAHELGHIALHHVPITKVTEIECMRFTKQEAEADRYAAFLLSDLFRSTAVTSLFSTEEGSNWGLDSYMGGSDFFAIMYSLAGFDRPVSSDTCPYPDKAVRLAEVKAITDQMSTEVQKEMEINDPSLAALVGFRKLWARLTTQHD